LTGPVRSLVQPLVRLLVRLRRGLVLSVAVQLTLLALLPAVATAAQTVSASSAARGPGRAAIASAHPMATAAGLEVLRAGGNAFDAAIAVTAALAVVDPAGSGLTGGGFYLLHRASDGREVMIDARETAPHAATRDMFLDAQGAPVPRLSMGSALAAGIPGEPAAMALLAERYGRLSAARSLAPAIRLAKSGFALTPRLRQGLAGQREQFAANPEVARNFLRKGAVPALGITIKQPELGATLAALARDGLRSFYSGELAQRLVNGVRAQGGIWSLEDLAAYREIERAPLIGSYHGARIVAAPPPSSGGVGLIEALNILSEFDLAKASSVDRKHLLIEASRRVHRDRAVYLGDPDFTPQPVARLTDQNYASGLAASLHTGRATASAALPGVGAGAAAGTQTTHFSVIDAEGNRVAATITLNFGFGSGRMIAGTGLFLNNEMDDFSVKPGVPNGYGLVGGEANAIAPGKRMLSSMSPTFVEDGDRVMIVGSPGGSFIIGMVLLATLDFLDGRSASEIVSAPRIHHQYLPDVVRAEPGALTDAERVELERRGHTVDAAGRRWGNLQTIIWNRATGTLEAAADPRGDGTGIVQ
jgi:gamma-glutamyltranspeptidase / glutathione hydrolase